MKNNPLKNQDGALLILIFIFAIILVMMYIGLGHMRAEKDNMQIRYQKKQNMGMQCKKSMKELMALLDVYRLETGKYPYELKGDFLEKHRDAQSKITNLQLWSPHANSSISINTAFGESYQLKGFCRNGIMYLYDSIDDEIYEKPYSMEDIEDPQ